MNDYNKLGLFMLSVLIAALVTAAIIGWGIWKVITAFI